MEIQSNNSSGSSMDVDHVPAKRLQTSTIIMCSSRATPASEQTIAEINTGHSFPGLCHPDTEPETASEHSTTTGPETEPEAGTEPEAEAAPRVPDTDTNMLSSHLSLIKDATTSTMPTSQHSPTIDMDVDEPSVGIHHTHKPTTDALITPPQPPPPAPAPDSDFVIGHYFCLHFCLFLTQFHSTFLIPPFSLMLILVMAIPLCLSCSQTDNKNTI